MTRWIAARLERVVEKAGGTPGIVEFAMEQSDQGWRIWAWSAGNRELCLEHDD